MQGENSYLILVFNQITEYIIRVQNPPITVFNMVCPNQEISFLQHKMQLMWSKIWTDLLTLSYSRCQVCVFITRNFWCMSRCFSHHDFNHTTEHTAHVVNDLRKPRETCIWHGRLPCLNDRSYIMSTRITVYILARSSSRLKFWVCSVKYHTIIKLTLTQQPNVKIE